MLDFSINMGSDQFSEKLEFHMPEMSSDQLFVFYFRVHLYSCRISPGITGCHKRLSHRYFYSACSCLIPSGQYLTVLLGRFLNERNRRGDIVRDSCW